VEAVLAEVLVLDFVGVHFGHLPGLLG
jgi:hypothetical protein